jgi:transcriptional regulator with XRE-family HTH domain
MEGIYMTTQASPGDLLRHYRRRKGWSQAQLAAKAGISTPFMTLIEQGRRRPREDAANHLVAALGLDETEAGELKAALTVSKGCSKMACTSEVT